ncbi:transcription antitermination factor NusB [Paenibacillus thermoaerophilus]|uniref:Transcription antitermination protein NusB n=1 Tax=Paenibacillus thermoaerophilus TaxID=1215385 RepID=A0ABW2V2J3_9BACL|nr:transcription antitermination factor NusB [Paenibacillus thermoaerophilus]TMV18781.1 transcription antitermination factor NusB [Paenibacillus thermoaerophilus]
MKRRLAREIALQSLYQVELAEAAPREAVRVAVEEALGDNEGQVSIGKEPISEDYILELVEGTVSRQAEIDSMLSGYLKGWRTDRLARIDRQVLRMATYEMVYRDDVPPKVVINEAIELVKQFGSEESGKFVNGVLGAMIKHLDQLKDRVRQQSYEEEKP